MNSDLHLSPAGAKLIQHFEGCLKPDGSGLFRPYTCPGGVLTIGWGSTNEGQNHFDSATRWTAEQCHKAFITDMESFEKSVRSLVKTPLVQHEFDALTSFTYNVGAGALKGSTLLKKLNSGDKAGAADEFLKWNKANGKVLAGLKRRRESERLLFLGVKDTDYDGRPDKDIAPPEHPMPQTVDNPEGN